MRSRYQRAMIPSRFAILLPKANREVPRSGTQAHPSLNGLQLRVLVETGATQISFGVPLSSVPLVEMGMEILRVDVLGASEPRKPLNTRELHKFLRWA